MCCAHMLFGGYGKRDKGVGGCWGGGSFSKQQVLVIVFFFGLLFLGEAGLAEPMMMQTWAQTLYG